MVELHVVSAATIGSVDAMSDEYDNAKPPGKSRCTATTPNNVSVPNGFGGWCHHLGTESGTQFVAKRYERFRFPENFGHVGADACLNGVKPAVNLL